MVQHCPSHRLQRNSIFKLAQNENKSKNVMINYNRKNKLTTCRTTYQFLVMVPIMSKPLISKRWNSNSLTLECYHQQNKYSTGVQQKQYNFKSRHTYQASDAVLMLFCDVYILILDMRFNTLISPETIKRIIIRRHCYSADDVA